jgi:hypothetical protein
MKMMHCRFFILIAASVKLHSQQPEKGFPAGASDAAAPVAEVASGGHAVLDHIT